MWYLHGPDRSVPYEVTLKAVNELYKEGKFKRFGISNYMSYVLTICFATLTLTPYPMLDGKLPRSAKYARRTGISCLRFIKESTMLFTGKDASIRSYR